jgi:dihydrofolate reductase
VGGGEIIAACLGHDLIDGFIVFIHPVILGQRIPIFQRELPERKLELVGTRK